MGTHHQPNAATQGPSDLKAEGGMGNLLLALFVAIVLGSAAAFAQRYHQQRYKGREIVEMEEDECDERDDDVEGSVTSGTEAESPHLMQTQGGRVALLE